MNIKRALSQTALQVTPLSIWNGYLRLRGRRQLFPWRRLGRMGTSANAKPLFEGRFAEAFGKYARLDPFHDSEATRYVYYNACVFGNLCRNVPGDFLCAGISFGVAARTLYDFVNFASLGKTLHLVDPFDARTTDSVTKKTPEYNSDPEYVRRQYPPGAPVVIHRQPIPIKLSGKLAFVFLSTGNPSADARALPNFYEALNPGGCILINAYANNIEQYEPVLARLAVEPLWLPSGQGVVIRNL